MELGYFLFRADLMLAELEAFVPEVLAAARAALEAAVTDLDFVRLDAAAFARAPKISIDYAVMERTARAGCCRCRSRGRMSAPGTRSGRCWTRHGRQRRAGPGVADRHEEQPRAQPGRGPDRGVGWRTWWSSPPRRGAGGLQGAFGPGEGSVNALRASGAPEADAHLRMYGPGAGTSASTSASASR